MNSVKDFGDHVFSRCTKLEKINIVSNNRSFKIGDDGVMYTKRLTKIVFYPPGLKHSSYVAPLSVTAIRWGAFSECKDLREVTVNSVKAISRDSFENCKKLTAVTMNSLEILGEEAFIDCVDLRAINIASDNPYFTVGDDGVIYDKEITEIILCPPGSTNETYTAPSTVRSIRPYAFSGCKNLKAVNIDLLEVIGGYAFYHCSGLKVVSMNSVKIIERCAFHSCEKLIKLNMNSEPKTDFSAFMYCPGIDPSPHNNRRGIW
jgi:hypothetical protein